MRLVLPEPPSANRYWRHARGRTYVSPEAEAYRLVVMAAWWKAKVKPLGCAVAVTLTWYRGRKSGDLDNRIKQVLDALQGLAYENDSQIVEIHAYRIDRPRHGSAEVTIREPLDFSVKDGTLGP